MQDTKMQDRETVKSGTQHVVMCGELTTVCLNLDNKLRLCVAAETV